MEHRTVKVCQKCGKSFSGSVDRHYCADCAKKIKQNSTIRVRTCVDCGISFYGGPRAMRCPECARERKKKVQKEWRRRGALRQLGSVDRCQICGAKYIVTSSRSKYCDDCKRDALLEWQRKRKKENYIKTNQYAKKVEKRKNQEKVCVYCLKKFRSNRPTNLCSDYCRQEQKRLSQCYADIRRGYNRDVKKLEEKREEYRQIIKH